MGCSYPDVFARSQALTPLTFGHGHVKASLLGALWGLGHSTGQLILGLMMVVLKDRFNSLVPALAKWGGTSVGLSLVCIGVMGLMELRAEAQAAQQEQLSSQPASANSQFAAQEAERARWSSQPALATEGKQQIARGRMSGCLMSVIMHGLQVYMSAPFVSVFALCVQSLMPGVQPNGVMYVVAGSRCFFRRRELCVHTCC